MEIKINCNIFDIDGKELLISSGVVMISSGAISMVYGLSTNVTPATEYGLVSFLMGLGVLAIAKKMD